jgi:glycosyltransferase XagB
LRLIADDELPVYSVLVPVFREIPVLNQLLTALKALDYPHHKLDIKLILEESDTNMVREVAGRTMPSYIEVIVVPSGKPQTKPRALNYALQFSRGSLITIYDAEDVPEPGQLRAAAEVFANAPPEMACVQARLVFYNPNENWLTRQFTIEYATLFSLVLPALAADGLPMPLGGTSNHFRTAILRNVGAWDPFNVTEDADLGFRLARAGYKTGVVDSVTYEEANARLGNWIHQRARWLKGFLQTWLVHMRDPWRSLSDLGLAGFWVLQATTIGLMVSVLFHPIILAYTIWMWAYMTPAPATENFFAIVLTGINITVFLVGYGVNLLAAHKALRKMSIAGWWGAILTIPVYWCLMFLAGWLAVWQFIWNPFHWNKTSHGLSSLQRPAPPSVHK